MKLSRRVWLILGAVIIVAALIVVGMFYFRQAGELGDLRDRLAEAQKDLPTLTTDKNTQQDRLTQAESLLDTSQAKFPESVESIEYGEYLFEIADDCNVNLASLSFPKPNDKKIGAVTYSVISMSLPVSGALADIFDFIAAIRTDARFASTEVKVISISMGGEGTSATISVDIYGYKG
jgi:hypothetical protein